MPSVSPHARLFALLACLLFLGGLMACVETDADAPAVAFPHTTERVALLQGTDRTILTTPPAGSCLELSSGECVQPRAACPDSQGSSIIVADQDGRLERIICLGEATSTSDIDSITGDLVFDDPGAMLVLDSAPDGLDVIGDVVLAGEGSTLLGFQSELSTLGGDLLVAGDRTTVYGAVIQGDVVLQGDQATLLDCEIQGDLEIRGDDALVQGCTVFGSVTATRLRPTLNYNLLPTTTVISPLIAPSCDDNQGFDDRNSDLQVGPGEVSGNIVCP